MRHHLAASLALILGAACAAHAQPRNANASELAGFNGLILTPAGALPQIVRAQRTMDTTTLGEVAVRYGRYNFRDPSVAFDNLGVTAFAHLLRRIQVGGTFGHRTCSGCQGVTMGSADLGLSLYRKAAKADIGGDTDVGLLLSAGIGTGKADTIDVKAHSFTASVPLAISLPQQDNSLLTLFVSPSLAYGQFSFPASNSAIMGIMGAGVSYAFRMGLGVHIELHRILIEDSPTQFGMALSYQFAR